MQERCFEQLAGWATANRFAAEIMDARETYFEGTGLIHEDDIAFEQRMAGLSEYYLLDRPLSFDSEGRTPAELFLAEGGEGLSLEEKETYAGFTRTIHGLFEIRRKSKDAVIVRDVLTQESCRVFERRRKAAILKKDIIEARLIPMDGRLIFGRTFIYHPHNARKLIGSWARALRKKGKAADASMRREAIWRLAQAALVYDRQRQNNRSAPKVELIYGSL